MSSSDQDRQRNREIAENEANRQVVGDVRRQRLGDRGRGRRRA